MAWQQGHRKVLLEVDSTAAVALIHKSLDGKHPYSSVIVRVQELMRRDWQVLIKHNYRESNRAADFLAARGHLLDLGVCFYLSYPLGLGDILIDDLAGNSMPRLVTL